jgi:hypothetical protein
MQYVQDPVYSVYHEVSHTENRYNCKETVPWLAYRI